MRVVTDTNVLVSAEVSRRGASRRLLDYLIARHNVILSNAILDEFARTLSAKFNYDGLAVSNVIEGFRDAVKIVEPTTFDRQICRDPDDDAILGTAVAGNADCIVTGDRDLLVLEQFEGVDIIPPSDFALYEARGIQEPE